MSTGHFLNACSPIGITDKMAAFWQPFFIYRRWDSKPAVAGKSQAQSHTRLFTKLLPFLSQKRLIISDNPCCLVDRKFSCPLRYWKHFLSRPNLCLLLNRLAIVGIKPLSMFYAYYSTMIVRISGRWKIFRQTTAFPMRMGQNTMWLSLAAKTYFFTRSNPKPASSNWGSISSAFT